MEIFVDVSGFSGYMVSNKGRVLGKTGKILKNQYNGGTGYEQIVLSVIGDSNKNAQIHRLVAEAFIPNPDNLPFVNHIDGNKRNNNVENLEWCTHQMNMQHAFSTGLMSNDFKHKGIQKLDKVTGEVLGTYQSITHALQEMFDVVTTTMVGNVSNVAKGRSKSSLGYKWRYLDETAWF